MTMNKQLCGNEFIHFDEWYLKIESLHNQCQPYPEPVPSPNGSCSI